MEREGEGGREREEGRGREGEGDTPPAPHLPHSRSYNTVFNGHLSL